MPIAAFTPQGVHDPLATMPLSGQRDSSWLAGCVLVAAAVHGIGAMTMPSKHPLSHRVREAPLEVIEMDVPIPSLPAPSPSEPIPPSVQLKPAAVAREPPPQAAQAGQVLTRSDAANDPLDLTGGFITGSAATFAGGTTTAAGRSQTVSHAVSATRNAAAPIGKPNGLVMAPDASRRARIVGGSSWQCPFPIEAAGIDQATVDLEVDVDVSGNVTWASVASDPGHGFGSEARRCVLDKKWQPALDRTDTPIASRATVRVRFTR